MPDDLIKKSIRLPADLDAYVDQQKGTTWTDKLCRILEDYRSGEETRAENMAYYNNWIKASQKKIDELARLQKDVDQGFGAHDTEFRLKFRVFEVWVHTTRNHKAVVVKVLIRFRGLLVCLLVEGDFLARLTNGLVFAFGDRLNRERNREAADRDFRCCLNIVLVGHKEFL